VALLRLAAARGWLPEPAGGMGEAAMTLAVVAGHMFTVFLKFRGGKGVSTAVGAVTAISPCAALGAFLVWLAVFKFSGYVSLGSIVAALALPPLAWLLSWYGIAVLSPAMLIFFALLALVAVWKHRSNIRRLLDGTENRFARQGHK